MSDQVIEPASPDGATVAVYHTHQAAEDAVRSLQSSGIPVNHISIIGRDWQVREDVQGFYHAGDAVAEGATSGAWFGGLFGLLLGFGLFVVPIAGTLLVLGPLGGLIAGAIGGAGIGAIVGGLMSLGIPKDQALKYQSQLQAGKFLVVVHGPTDEIARAHGLLEGSEAVSEVATHSPEPAAVV